MARRMVTPPTGPRGPVADPGEKVVIPHDPVNEVAVLSAALRDQDVLDGLLRRILPDHFLARENREAWVALGEVRRRQLKADDAAVRAVAGDAVAQYLVEVISGVEPAENLEWHVQNLLWDSARATAARGPVPAFLEALRDPRAEPERVRSLARQVSTAFEGYEDRLHLHDPDRLVREQMLEIEQRVAGHATYPFGLPGLDFYDPAGGRRRMIPGAAPGEVTVVTSTSGGGKSTLTANLALGLAFPEGIESDAPGRKICYGAWEMRGGTTLELIACISLGWSRTDLTDPGGAALDAPINTHEGRVLLQERMARIASRIRFMGMPFKRRSGEKASNERNLDLLQGYIADTGCDVFIADLWKRCLRDASPEAEEDALIRQQAMVEELRIHAILLQQQRLKDIEMRPDKRPTREGIKGSAAWVEVADNIIAPHRPALWKRIDDDKIEIFILKQRKGKWPLGIEFDWDADRGLISGGRPIEYDRPGEATEYDGDFLNQRHPRGPRRRVS